MKVVTENFNYKGHHFERVEFDMPGVKEFDEIVEERIVDYLKETLDVLIEEKES